MLFAYTVSQAIDGSASLQPSSVRLRTVRVDIAPFKGTSSGLAGIVHVDVLEEHFFGSRYRHRPHLATPEAEAFDDRVRGICDRDGMRPSVKVRGPVVVVVPDLSVAVKSAVSVAIEVDCQTSANIPHPKYGGRRVRTYLDRHQNATRKSGSESPQEASCCASTRCPNCSTLVYL